MTERLDSPCADCGANTTQCNGHRGWRHWFCRPHRGRWELYMATDDVWTAAGAPRGYLCIGCLERRIGRRLNSDDFADVDINRPHHWYTDRLEDRKSSPPP